MLPGITDSIVFEGYVLNRAHGTLSWHQETIPLSRKTYDLLLHLVDHRDRVVTKDELYKALWPQQVVEDGNLTQQVFILRKALARHGDGKIIETIAGRGYRFIAPVAAPEATAPALTLHVQVDHSVARVAIESEETQSARVSRVLVAGLVVLAAVVAGSYGWRYWENRAGAQPVDVVLADFGDAFGDSSIARPLNDAIRIDLAQSPFVTVVSPSKVRATLKLMLQKPGVALDAALAREVCERTGAQAFIQGQVAQFGAQYLAILRATHCGSGELIAENKEQAARLDDLPHAIDVLAAKIRRDLGESRASIRRFDTPLITVTTGSLAALKAYSEGKRLYNRGDFIAALPFFQNAVAIDPQFGGAYLDMAGAYYNLRDETHLRASLIEAYSLRDTVSESIRYYLIAFYHHEVTGDIYKSLETYQTWANLYPNSKAAIGSLAVEYENVGRAADAVPLGRRALELDPANYAVYQNLASFELHSGDLEGAQQTCQMTIAKDMDTEGIRDLLLNVMYTRNDLTGVDAQLEWGRAHDHPLQLMVDEVMLAITRGEIRRARTLIAKITADPQLSERDAERQTALTMISRMLADFQLRDDSLRMLASLGSYEPNEDALVALAESGEVAQAAEMLQATLAKHGHETLWANAKAPQVKSAISLAQHQAPDAIQALAAALPFDGLSLGPTYLRGSAYLAAGDLDNAGVEFHKIIQHPYVDSLSNLIPLAVLQMARVSLQKKDFKAAAGYYRQLFELWKNADQELPPLVAARQEFSTISGSPPAG